MTYSTAQIHHRLGVPKPTIRNWTVFYADFLSEGAQPDDGRRRVYTHADLVTLNTIRYLTRIEGLTNREEVHQRLAEGFRVDDPPDASAKRRTDDPVGVLRDTLAHIDERLLHTEHERDQALVALNRAHRQIRGLHTIRERLRGLLAGISVTALGLLLMLIAAALLIGLKL